MVHEYKLIEVEEAHLLRDILELLDDAYYIDRSVYSPNQGLNGEIGSYHSIGCLLYTSPSPRDGLLSRMPSSA